MTRIYISGPMTGLPEFNVPAFREAAQQLRAAGWDVCSPAEIGEQHGLDVHAARHPRALRLRRRSSASEAAA